jgi:hypothetical protein
LGDGKYALFRSLSSLRTFVVVDEFLCGIETSLWPFDRAIIRTLPVHKRRALHG